MHSNQWQYHHCAYRAGEHRGNAPRIYSKPQSNGIWPSEQFQLSFFHQFNSLAFFLLVRSLLCTNSILFIKTLKTITWWRSGHKNMQIIFVCDDESKIIVKDISLFAGCAIPKHNFIKCISTFLRVSGCFFLFLAVVLVFIDPLIEWHETTNSDTRSFWLHTASIRSVLLLCRFSHLNYLNNSWQKWLSSICH